MVRKSLLVIGISGLLLSSCTSKRVFRRPEINQVKSKDKVVIIKNYNQENAVIDEYVSHDIDEEIESELDLHFDALVTEQEQKFFDLGKKADDPRIFFNWPLASRSISSNFGYRNHPISKKKLMHNGVDFRAKKGTPIYASQSGTVIISKNSPTYGNVIAIAHSNGYVTLYGHNDLNLVKKGDYVERNQKIGTVGNSGKSTGPHLHFEVRRNKINIDPIAFLKNQKIN